MDQYLRKIFYSGLPSDSDSDLLKKFALFNVVIGVYLLITFFFTIYHLKHHQYLLAVSLLCGAILMISIRWRLAHTNKHQHLFSLSAAIMVVIFLINFITGGTDNYGPLWYYTFPMVALILLGARWGTLFCMSLLVLSILVLFPPLDAIMTTSYETGFLWRFFMVYLIIYLMAVAYEVQRELAGKKIKELSGLLPICASCNKIRDDTGYWNRLENYLRRHADVDFSHGICPDCIRKLYPEVDMDEMESD